MCRSGATLLENHSVKGASLDKSSGLWTVELEGSDVTYQGRVLVCADGAPSTLATKLGIVTTAPQGSCSRAYVEKGTHRFKADGVVFYNKLLLPGMLHVLKHNLFNSFQVMLPYLKTLTMSLIIVVTLFLVILKLLMMTCLTGTII